MADLTDRDRAILDLAGRPAPASEAEIRERLDLSATRFHQLLGALLSRPEALAYAPSTVKRHQRLTFTRRARRSAS